MYCVRACICAGFYYYKHEAPCITEGFDNATDFHMAKFKIPWKWRTSFFAIWILISVAAVFWICLHCFLFSYIARVSIGIWSHLYSHNNWTEVNKVPFLIILPIYFSSSNWHIYSDRQGLLRVSCSKRSVPPPSIWALITTDARDLIWDLQHSGCMLDQWAVHVP